MERLILNKSKQLFFTYGIKGVSMDDISKGLGMSKKTIYQYYKDKNEIIGKIVDEMLVENVSYLNQIHEKRENVVEEVYMVTHSMGQQVGGIQNAFFYELEKSYPEYMEKLNTYKIEVLLKKIKQNLEEGVASGVYRSEINPSETALIRLSLIEDAFTNFTFLSAGWQTKDILVTLTNFYLHGITSQTGKELINKYIYKAG